MNCDQVFDVLTRGPFPTGTACDPPVEAHLAVCPECRRLAEALRPALELFQESIGPEESRLDLPGYWCAVEADRPQPVVSAAAAPRRSQPQRVSVTVSKQSSIGAGGFTALAAWRLAAALALGVTLGSLVGTRSPLRNLAVAPPHRLSPPAAVAFGEPEPPSRSRDRLTLAALPLSERQFLASLPAACSSRRPGAAQRNSLSQGILASADLSNLECCADCHNSRSADVPQHATVSVAKRCQLCHIN